jgi:hypothetical protein
MGSVLGFCRPQALDFLCQNSVILGTDRLSGGKVIFSPRDIGSPSNNIAGNSRGLYQSVLCYSRLASSIAVLRLGSACTLRISIPSSLVELGVMFRFSLLSLLLITAAFAAWLLVFSGDSMLARSTGVLLYAIIVLAKVAYDERTDNVHDEESRRARKADESNPAT